MKRVLVISGGLQLGGAESVAASISIHAPKGEYEIHYLVFEGLDNEYGPEIERHGGRIITIPSPSEGYRKFFCTLLRLMKAERYDVVHAHTMFNSGWAMLAGKLCGVPVRITHSHSIRGFEKRNLLKNTYEKTMRLLILTFATQLVACGRDAGAWLFGERAFSRKGKLIYNGIDLDVYAYDEAAGAAIRTELGLQDDYVIGHAGHLAAVKNQSFLLELMPRILQIKPNAHLLLLGDGTDRSMLEKKIQALGIQEHVTMTGNVSNVGAYLSAMDVFAFPSRYEGMPLALVEAQANGLPCCVSDRIPEDAKITELARSLPLEPDAWLLPLTEAARDGTDRFFEQLKVRGFGIDGMLKKVFDLYEGLD